MNFRKSQKTKIVRLLAAGMVLSMLFAVLLPVRSPLLQTVRADGLEQGGAGSGFVSETELEETFASLAAEAEAEGTAYDGFLVALKPDAVDLSHAAQEQATELLACAEPLCVADSADALLDDYDVSDIVSVEPNYVISLFDADAEPQTDKTLLLRADAAVDKTAVEDTLGHGTLCASIILSAKNNGRGIAGIVPEAYLLPLKAFGGKNSSLSLVFEAINYAVEQKKLFDSTNGAEGINVGVINMSFGGTFPSDKSKEFKLVCENAADAGILLVASAGNATTADDTTVYPAAYDCVVGVGSVGTSSGSPRRSSFSQTGRGNVFCTAPGEAICGAYAGADNAYAKMTDGNPDSRDGKNGTSFSAPVVSALAVLAKSIDPQIDYAAFEQLLQDTSVDLGEAGQDDEYGYGMVDFQAAVEQLTGNPLSTDSEALKPDDPFYTEEKQEYLKFLHVPSVWQNGYEGQPVAAEAPVVVAVIDSGIRRSHEDFDPSHILTGQNWTETEETEELPDIPAVTTPETAPISSPGAGKDASSAVTTQTVKKVTPKVTLSATVYTYNGKTKKPRVAVKVNGKKLATSCYTVSYASGRKKVGTYKVTVKLKNGYSGSKTVTFKIKPRPVKASVKAKSKNSVTLKWTKRTTQVSGYQIQYSTAKNFQTKKTVTIKNIKTTSRKISGLRSKKTYYVRVRTYKTVDGKKYCSAWSDVKKIKIR